MPFFTYQIRKIFLWLYLVMWKQTLSNFACGSVNWYNSCEEQCGTITQIPNTIVIPALCKMTMYKFILAVFFYNNK